MNLFKFLVTLFFLFEIFSCNQNGNTVKKEEDTMTTGTIRVTVDETLKPLMEAEFNVFAYQYPEAHLIVSYKPEGEVMNDFKNDSARAIVLARELTTNEFDYFKSIQYIPKAVPFALDGISIIVNKNAVLDSFRANDLKLILTGKSATETVVVFDNSGSSTVRLLRDSLLKKEPLAKNCFALHNNQEVIDYIGSHENAIGIIGTSWISDRDDSNVTVRLRKIKRARIAAENSNEFLEPFQTEIETGTYAFRRTIYCIQRDGKMGLGTGLQHFLYEEKGQTIVLKFGMMPYTPPVRSVKWNAQ